MKRLGFILLVLFVTLAFGVLGAEVKYHFYFVSHMGPADPNSNWFTTAIPRFEARYPEVDVEYVTGPQPTPQLQLELLRTVLAKNPDGLIISMTAPEMFDPILREAIERGIPVIAFNIPDPRPREERIPYLCYVGGDEYLTGLYLGEAYLKKWGKPTKAVCALFNPAHVGLVARCKGMGDAMSKAGVPYETLALSPEAGTSISVLTSYLKANPDVDLIFSTTTYGEPWIVQVLRNLGKEGKVDIVGVDASPTSLEGIKRGIIKLTHSQGFYLQAWLPMEFLYLYNEYGLAPVSDVITGPTVIDKSNVDTFINLVKSVFGEEVYDKLVGW